MKARTPLVLILFALTRLDVSACIFSRSETPPYQTRTELYDPTFVRQHLIVHKSTTADVEKLYGKPDRPSVSSDGSESWSYSMSTTSHGGLARSAVVRGVSALWSHVPSNTATNVSEAEYNKAHGGGGSASAVADQTVGKEKTESRSIYFRFKDGVLDSYTIN